MKNFKKIIITLGILLGITILSLIGIKIVNAGVNDNTIVKNRYDGIYAVYDLDDGTHLAYAQRYTLNGVTAYCIEMGVDINTDTYSSTTDLSVTGLSNELIRYLRLVAYYGYDYDGHNTMNYYLAGQEMMWEKITGKEVYWVTSLNVYGDKLNVDSEKNEIARLIENHTKLPSFDENVVELNVGENVTLTDNNGVLSQYELYNTDLENVTINGNTITITADNTTSEKEIQLIKKNYLTKATLIYYSGSNQKLINAGALDPVISTITVVSTGGDVTINKLDKDTQKNEPQGVEATLEGAVYGVYNTSDTLITTITTDENGYVKSDTLPEMGEYYLKEITASKGYELDDNKYYFSITNDNLYPVINVYENIIKSEIEINKYFASGTTGILIPESNIEFAIYDSKENLVTTIKTDDQGYASTNLVYGTYTVKQLNSTSGYEKVEDFKIVVNNESPSTIKYSLTDAPITAKIKLVKIDSESGNTILFTGATFKIKNIDTNEYVCQKVSYPKQEEICGFSTNELGEFITPNTLVSGTYQIEEITSPDGYLISDENYTFRIDEESNFIEDEESEKYILVEFSNKKIKGNISIEKTGELFKVADNSFSYTDIELKGVEFSLYAGEDITTLDGVTHYTKGDLIKTMTTDTNGKLTFTDLYLGKYIVKETKTLDNYILDTNEYSVELTEVDNKTALVNETLKIKNELIKNDLEFTKTDLVSGEVIPNTLIQIYTDEEICIFEGRTDKDGKIIIKDLPIGKYYIIETEPATGYVITKEKVYFEILEGGEIVKAKMTNKPIVGGLEFTKIDFSTSEPIPNTLIEIYKETEGEEPELIYSGRTDKDGKIIIKELLYGRYFILEKETATPDYVLNTEKMYFEILEDGEIVKSTMVNEKVVVEVPSTGVTDFYIIEIIGGLLILSGIGVIIYVLKKKKKN